MLGIIVLMEYPTSLQLQSLDWPANICLYNFLIFGGIHSFSFCLHNISCAPSWHTSPKHNGSTSMLNSWHGVLLYKGFTLFSAKDSFFGGGQKVTFLVWSVQSTLFQKALGFSMFSFAYFRCVMLWSGCREGLFLATLPCRSLLFKEHCIAVLWTAVACVCYCFYSSFAVMCRFFWGFLIRSRAILSEHFFSLPELALTSTVPFVFHFLIMFLTVGIGSLKHRGRVFVASSFLVEINHLHSDILGQLVRGTHGC